MIKRMKKIKMKKKKNMKNKNKLARLNYIQIFKGICVRNELFKIIIYNNFNK